MPLNYSQQNLVEIDQDIYSKIEERIEQGYFHKHIGAAWHSANDKISVLKRKDGTVLLFEEFSILNGRATSITFKVESQLLNLYNQLFSKE
jgi:hypothetical protein